MELTQSQKDKLTRVLDDVRDNEPSPTGRERLAKAIVGDVIEKLVDKGVLPKVDFEVVLTPPAGYFGLMKDHSNKNVRPAGMPPKKDSAGEPIGHPPDFCVLPRSDETMTVEVSEDEIKKQFEKYRTGLHMYLRSSGIPPQICLDTPVHEEEADTPFVVTKED